MHTKKIKIFLLVFLLSFSFGLVGLAPLVQATEQARPEQGADTGKAIYMLVDKKAAKAGDEVTVSIVNKTGTPLTSGSFNLSFNDEQFEIIGYQLLGAKPIVRNPNKSEPGHISIYKSVDAGNPCTDETVASFTFKVKSDFTGNSNFQMDEAKIGAGETGSGVQKLELANKSVVVAGQKDPVTNPGNSGQEIPKPKDPDAPIKTSPNELKPIEPEKKPKETEKEPKENETKTPSQSLRIVEMEDTKPSENRPSNTKTAKPGQSPSQSKNKVTQPIEPDKRGLRLPAGNGPHFLGVGQQETKVPKYTLGRQGTARVLETLDREKVTDNRQTPAPQETSRRQESAPRQVNRVTPPVVVKKTKAEKIALASEETSEVELEIETTPPTSASSDKRNPDSEKSKKAESTSKKALQAKQEREFKLTGQETELHNKIIVGGLALITVSSAGALAFLIFNNHIKPR